MMRRLCGSIIKQSGSSWLPSSSNAATWKRGRGKRSIKWPNGWCRIRNLVVQFVMSDVTENKVLQGINELRDTLARDNPPFAEAMADERRTEAFCARVRAELASSRKAMHLDQAEM